MADQWSERNGMEKQEFIEKLKISLNGRVPSSVVMENVNFYEDYINTEIQKGRSQQEVLNTLGDPRLIARTIAETNQQGTGETQEGNYREAQEDSVYQDSSRDSVFRSEMEGNRKIVRVPGWVWLVGVILVVVLVLSAVFSVLSFLMPVILPVLLVLFLVKLFRDWLN